MRSSTLLTTLLTLTTYTVLAQDVESNDVPTQCSAVCAPVVSLTAQCDRTTDNDSDERNCLCNGQNAASIIPACEACYAMYDNDGHDNDVHDILTECSFTTTSYNPSATSSSMTMTGTSSDSTATGTAMTSASTGAPQSASASSSESTGAAGPMKTVGVGMAAVVGGVACLMGL